MSRVCVSCINLLVARVSHASLINLLRARRPNVTFINLSIARGLIYYPPPPLETEVLHVLHIYLL